MSVIWSGVTEEGAVVPVQVTNEGKVVAVGDGPEGDYLPITGGTLTGDLKVLDKVALNVDGSASFANRVSVVGLTSTASILADRTSADDVNFLNRLNGTSTARWQADGTIILGTSQDITLNANGSASFADNTQVGGTPTGGVAEGVLLRKNGRVEAASNQGSTPIWEGYRVGTAAATSTIKADGSAEFAGNINANGVTAANVLIGKWIRADSNISVVGDPGSYLIEAYATSASLSNLVFGVKGDGSASFKGDVIIGSRGEQWLIRESNGVAMLVMQSREAAPMTGVSPMIPEKVRDIPNELDLIEMALNEVMEKLRMTPPAGWPVWDGSDNP